MIPASNYGSASKPKLITRYTSGTGTYVPSADMARCLVRIQAGGAGGNSAAGVGGGAGAMVEAFVRVPIAGVAYVVGASAAAATAGNKSSFDTLVANPGLAGASGFGGALGVCPVNAAMVITGGAGGAAGGGGGAGTNGCGVGTTAYILGNAFTVTNGFGVASGTQGGGGDAFFGKGGNGNNAGVGVAGNGYGSGGGAGSTTGGAGAGGLIEIWDFGA